MASNFYQILVSQKSPIGERYRAIFELKHLQTQEAINLLLDAFNHLNNSELLKHQLVYTIGQIQQKFYPLIKKFLFSRVADQNQQKLVRHQAAEALANYFDKQAIELLDKYTTCGISELQITCRLALTKIKNDHMKNLYGKQYFETRQPAAPFTQKQFKQYVSQSGNQKTYDQQGTLGLILLDIPIQTKYRILYYLRNRGDKNSKDILCKLLSLKYFKTQSSLFKHQICFVLGQIGIQQGSQEDMVRQCIENAQQQDIVRHQALAAIASQSKDQKYLQKLTNHPSQIIRESALVAIDEIRYWKQ